MALKSDIYHKDYLLWISPVIILVLLFFAIRKDNKERESAILNSFNSRADSSITMFIQNKELDFGEMPGLLDGDFVFYATIKGN
jgi:hypothetical protein